MNNNLQYIKQPTISCKYRLKQIKGVSELALDALSMNMMCVDQVFETINNSLRHSLIIQFCDVLDGTTSLAIKELCNIMPPIIEIDTYGSILRFKNCRIKSITYNLSYASYSNASYVVTYEPADWQRTLD